MVSSVIPAVSFMIGHEFCSFCTTTDHLTKFQIIAHSRNPSLTHRRVISKLTIGLKLLSYEVEVLVLLMDTNRSSEEADTMSNMALAFNLSKDEEKSTSKKTNTYVNIRLSEQGQKANALALRKINEVWSQYLGREISPS